MKDKVLKTVNVTEEIVLIIMFAVMVAVIFSQVIMRKVFNNSLPWSEELGKFLFVWLSWLGISIGHRRKEHIKITLLVEKLPILFKKVVEAASELILIIICGVTVYYSVLMLDIQKNIPYAGIKISTSWGYLSLVLGCSFFIMRASVYFIQAVKSIKEKDFSM